MTTVLRLGMGAAASFAPGLGSAEAASPSRFASYDSEAQCVAARTIAPGLCHSAFANARAEYEAKTPAFASQTLCTQHYASCMAWPPGGGAGRVVFRPAWDGVDIVDTPTEHSVTPSPGSTGKAVRFAARPLTDESRTLVIRGGVGAPLPPSIRTGAPVGAGRPRTGLPPLARHEDGAPAKVPPPGSGFKMEDGVLTYPAPERFQPRNLPKQN